MFRNGAGVQHLPEFVGFEHKEWNGGKEEAVEGSLACIEREGELTDTVMICLTGREIPSRHCQMLYVDMKQISGNITRLVQYCVMEDSVGGQF